MPAIRKSPKFVAHEREILRRVQLIMQKRNISAAELGKRLQGLIGWGAGPTGRGGTQASSSALYQWSRRGILPAGGIVAALPKALGVSSEWLFFDEGSPDHAAPTPTADWVLGGEFALAKVDAAVQELRKELRQAQPAPAAPVAPPTSLAQSAQEALEVSAYLAHPAVARVRSQESSSPRRRSKT